MLHCKGSRRGLTNGGSSPDFSEKIEGKSFFGKSGLFGANRGLFRAYRGRSGSIPPHPTATGRAEIALTILAEIITK